ncbi:MAG: GAF domain-containing protein [Cyclobacteriaceae bacterium]|nr:GAF domain-containing protein [Cyclobacteriaceae bacterium]
MKVSHILAGLFLAGVLISAYMLYSIPGSLQLTNGFASLAAPYIVIALTFAFGLAALIFMLEYKKELIVIRDRVVKTQEEDANTENAGASSYSINTIQQAVKGSKNATDVLHKGLQALGKTLQVGQGAIYKVTSQQDQITATFIDGYAFTLEEGKTVEFDSGDGLIGQAVASGKALYIDEVPEGYINIVSGLGNASSRYLLIVPIKKENNVLGVFELASFTAFDQAKQKFAEAAAQIMADKLDSKN